MRNPMRFISALLAFICLASVAEAGSVRSVGTALAPSTRSSHVLVAPSSITNGDKLVAILQVGSSASGVAAPVVTAPGGFTEISAVASGMLIAKSDPYSTTVRVFVKTASSESGNYTFTTPVGVESQGIMYALQTTGTVNAGTAGTGTLVSASGSVTAPSVTTTTANTVVIWLGLGWDGLGPTVVPTGTTPTFTERVDTGAIYVADGVLASAGATGTKAITAPAFSPTNYWAAIMLYADDAGGGSAPVLSSPTPSGTIGTATTASVGATTDQTTGTLYCVLSTTNNVSTATATQVKAGQNSTGASAAFATSATVSTTTPACSFSGQTASTLYYAAEVQNNANGDSNVVATSFTTATTPPPSTPAFRGALLGVGP